MNPRGQRAEANAAEFLRRAGAKIIERNWRCRFGEIDLIAIEGKMLVFVEVRQRSSRSHGGAAESISLTKRRRLTAAANLYLANKRGNLPCRFDALLIDADGQIEWLRNAFEAT